MAELRSIDGVHAGYGNAAVLEAISFTLDAGDSLALLGRNGMGKTTLLATLMGAARLTRGTLRFGSQHLAAVPSHRRPRLGLGWVPQECDIFASLAVEETLTVVARPRAWDLGPGKGLRPVPALARAARQPGQPTLGWRTADAGAGPRPAAESQSAAARRTAGRPGTVDRAGAAGQHRPDGAREQHGGDPGRAAAHQILPLTRNPLVLKRGRVVHHGPSDVLSAEAALLDRWLVVTTP